ncbi:MAG: hypothetical protein KKH28_05750 [Elusimicrobia bacterium]|nr:hypothetical protein [Elusimicrobiota bacterium]
MTADGKKAFLLRVDPRLWNELQGWAAQELRSVNAQIEYILKEAVARRRSGGPPPGKAGKPAGR